MAVDMTEEDLMVAYQKGDRKAFERLFATLAPAIHGFFLRSFGGSQKALADDLLQMTFLKIHKARATYDKTRPLRPWVFTIAARVRLDELRKRYALPEDTDEETFAAADEARAVAAAQEAAVDDRSDLQEKVRAALDRLPESQRVVVHLHRYEELTFAEIAKILGSTEGAVKLRAFRAYERLRKELAGLLEGEDAA